MKEPWHDLTLRVVTPAFLGRFDSGDPQTAAVPFPVPSLRGVLAYWLRALAGARLGNAIDQLHDVESAVFGSARTERSGGPSPIQIRGGRVRLSVLPADRTPDGMRYLMGPGLTSGSQPPRCLTPGPLELRVRNLGTPASADLFLAALWALHAFGGVGARTRRGFGTLAVDHVPSLAIQRFDPAWLGRDSAADLASVIACVVETISDLGVATGGSRSKAHDDVPHYPCFAAGRYRFSADEEDQLYGTAGDWRAALDNAGTWFWGFRHGASRRIPGSQPPSGTHSQTYNDVVRPFLDHAPGRHGQKGPLTAAALGLPVPYTDHQGHRGADGKPAQRKATVNVEVDGQPARRASPLWLRVRHDGTAWRLRSLAFHTEWLPPAPRTRLTISAGPRSAPVNRPTDQQITEELNRWFDA
jgi:hypothetical protein